MRWKAKPKPRLDARRTTRSFLFLPVQYPIGGWGGKEEWRWWEWVRVKQIWGGTRWHNFYWAEEETT